MNPWLYLSLMYAKLAVQCFLLKKEGRGFWNSPFSDPAGDHGAVAAQPEQPAVCLHPPAWRGRGLLLGRGGPLQRRLGRHEDARQGGVSTRFSAFRYRQRDGKLSPTFGDFDTIFTVMLMQDVIVARSREIFTAIAIKRKIVQWVHRVVYTVQFQSTRVILADRTKGESDYTAVIKPP